MRNGDAREEYLVVFIDSLGEETQELAAICFDVYNLSIKGVYLNWANNPSKRGICDVDWFSRKHVHGINRTFLMQNGLKNENELVGDFQSWLRQYNVIKFYGNASCKEECLLNTTINDVNLPQWSDRPQLECFRIAKLMKNMELSVKGKSCSPAVHCEYGGWAGHKSVADFARKTFGHECALYNCVLILLFIFPKAKLFSS